MTDILIAILAILFVLGVAINIHEFGHFIVAKIFGMRVEAYSFFGLGPRIFGFKIGHTDYRISAIPLGAYVKLYGDDGAGPLEAKDATTETVPDSELYELRPRWQKFLVMLGGPFMNFVLAFSIPFGMALYMGVPIEPPPIVGAVKAGGAAEQAGIQVGDRVVKFDTVSDPTWERVYDDALLSPEKAIPLTVERDGKRIDLNITPATMTQQGQTAGDLQMSPDAGVEPVVVGSFKEGMPAESSGLKVGDVITSVNGKTVRNPQEMKRMVGENKDAPINLAVEREGQRLDITTSAVQSGDEYLIGIGFDSSRYARREAATLATAAGYSLETNLRTLRMTGKALGQVGTGERSAKDTVSGPIGIVQVIISAVFSAGFIGLLIILTMISLSLGVMNLLPIPMLDGGQIMVLGIEKVLSWFGRTLSIVARERIQLTGLGIVLFLMLAVTYFDLSKVFTK